MPGRERGLSLRCWLALFGQAGETCTADTAGRLPQPAKDRHVCNKRCRREEGQRSRCTRVSAGAEDVQAAQIIGRECAIVEAAPVPWTDPAAQVEARPGRYQYVEGQLAQTDPEGPIFLPHSEGPDIRPCRSAGRRRRPIAGALGAGRLTSDSIVINHRRGRGGAGHRSRGVKAGGRSRAVARWRH